MLKGEVFFDFEYTYHSNGSCEGVKTTNANGVVKVRHYDRKGKPLPDNHPDSGEGAARPATGLVE